jgi:hypothetical protein
MRNTKLKGMLDEQDFLNKEGEIQGKRKGIKIVKY